MSAFDILNKRGSRFLKRFRRNLYNMPTWLVLTRTQLPGTSEYVDCTVEHFERSGLQTKSYLVNRTIGYMSWSYDSNIDPGFDVSKPKFYLGFYQKLNIPDSFWFRSTDPSLVLQADPPLVLQADPPLVLQADPPLVLQADFAIMSVMESIVSKV